MNIIPTSSLDILNPVIILGYKELYLQANYCYIPLLKRYYYINSVSLEIGKQITMGCSIDILMSYDSDIRNCTACIVRNEGIGAPTYIPDTSLPVHPSEQEVTAILFDESPFNTNTLYSYILSVLRGGTS